LAGHGGANVTLGIPRLREVLMTASMNIKTPLMILHFKEPVDKMKAEEHANIFRKVRMNDLVKYVEITQGIIMDKFKSRVREYSISLQFESLEQIKKAFSMDFEQLKKEIKETFVPILLNVIGKTVKKGAASSEKIEDYGITSQKIQKESKESVEEDELQKEETILSSEEKTEKSDEDDDELMEESIGDEEGNEGSKQLSKKKQMASYEEDEVMDKGEDGEEEKIEQPKRIIPKTKEFFDEKEQQDLENIENMKARNSKFELYLNDINFDEDKESIDISLVFPLETKKFLILNLVESALSQVLVHSINGIERCFALQKIWKPEV